MSRIKTFWRRLPEEVRRPLHPVSLAIEIIIALLLTAVVNAIRSLPPLSLTLLGIAGMIATATVIGGVAHRRIQRQQSAQVEAPAVPEYTTEATIRRDGSVRLRLIGRDPQSEPVGWTCAVQDPRFPNNWFYPAEIYEQPDRRARLEVAYPNIYEDAPALPLEPGWYMARWKQAIFDPNSGAFLGHGKDLATQRFEIGRDGQIVGQPPVEGWSANAIELLPEAGGPGILLSISSERDQVALVECRVRDPKQVQTATDNLTMFVTRSSAIPSGEHQFLYPSDFSQTSAENLEDGDYWVEWFDVTGAGRVPLVEHRFTMRKGHLW